MELKYFKLMALDKVEYIIETNEYDDAGKLLKDITDLVVGLKQVNTEAQKTPTYYIPGFFISSQEVSKNLLLNQIRIWSIV
jgi:hypothetical protein